MLVTIGATKPSRTVAPAIRAAAPCRWLPFTQYHARVSQLFLTAPGAGLACREPLIHLAQMLIFLGVRQQAAGAAHPPRPCSSTGTA